MKLRHGIMVSVILGSWFSFSADTSNVPSKSLNIAVFGGSINAYAALYSAIKLVEHVGKPFKEIFDQAWAISGGTIPATLLMKGAWHGKETELFKSAVGQALPDNVDFHDLEDETGARRQKFENSLKEHFAGLNFGAQKDNGLVYIASAEGAPVFFCDPEIEFGPAELRCMERTSCIEGILGSCSLRQNIKCGPRQIQYSLFKVKKLGLLPSKREVTILDGSHCNANQNGRFALDGFTPTPLVIEYLKSIPGTHNVVVFDNGGETNHEFRRSIKLSEDGIASIEHGASKINVYVISVEVSGFATNVFNKTPERLTYLEGQVNRAIAGKAELSFTSAVSAMSKGKE